MIRKHIKIKAKLILFYTLILVISLIISFILTFIVMGKDLVKERDHYIDSVATLINQLTDETDLSKEDITKLTNLNSFYKISTVDIEDRKLNSVELSTLKNIGIVKEKNHINRNYWVYIKADDDIYEILYKNNNILKESEVTRMILLVVTCITLSIIMLLIGGKRALMPIYKLNIATKKVAKGDFDVKIEKNMNDEIGELSESFNKMVNELKGIELFRNDFISSISHEFKTPLSSINGFAKLLTKDNILDSDRKDYANIIVDETERLVKLSSNILRLSKLENMEISFTKKTFKLDEQIRKIVLLMEPEWSRKNIDFDIELERINYTGDIDLLNQVWINLLSNAIKFSHSDGIIKIRLYENSDKIIVKIKDYGVGMSEDTKKRIFEKFYQGDKSHSIKGNGLGLSIVKRIVELSNGEISVDSAIGQGTTFLIKLNA